MFWILTVLKYNIEKDMKTKFTFTAKPFKFTGLFILLIELCPKHIINS